MSGGSLFAGATETDAGDPARELRIGLGITIAFFVLFLGWAALAPLDAGVYAMGQIAVLGNRQSVQDKDGGVISALHVHEGEHVRAGEVLVELSAPELSAAERSLSSDYLTLLAQRARLIAERAGQETFDPPPEFATLPQQDQQLAQQVLALQRSEMVARAESDSAQRSVLGERAGQLQQQQVGYVKQRDALVREQQLIQQEVDGLMSVAAKGFASMNRVRELQRAQADLQGQEAAMRAEYARAAEGIGETKMQSLTVTRQRLESIESDLKDTQAKLSETLPKLIAAREQLQESLVRAPVTGQVVGLTVFTIGGVVKPGDTLMNIVPDGRELVVQTQVKPSDADKVYVGQQAQIRFVSIHNRSLPLITGTVRTMSADSFTDEKTGRAFFRAEIVVPERELRTVRSVLGSGEIRPGLPVEAVMTERKRTALEYLLEPLTAAMWRSGHED